MMHNEPVSLPPSVICHPSIVCLALSARDPDAHAQSIMLIIYLCKLNAICDQWIRQQIKHESFNCKT